MGTSTSGDGIARAVPERGRATGTAEGAVQLDCGTAGAIWTMINAGSLVPAQVRMNL